MWLFRYSDAGLLMINLHRFDKTGGGVCQEFVGKVQLIPSHN